MKEKTKKNSRLEIRLPEEAKVQLKSIAATEGKTITKVIEEQINVLIKKRQAA